MYQAHKFYALDCNVLAVSYRGFGASGGVPSEKGMYCISFAFFYFIKCVCERNRLAERCAGGVGLYFESRATLQVTYRKLN